MIKDTKGKKPLVSVIVPIYNSRDYLAQCIESVLKQSYSNLEIILSDDASTDGSFEIEMAYAGMDSRIKVLREERNAGVGHARNIGMKMAKGEYCCFIDSDDVADQKMIETFLALILEHHADIVAGGEYCPENPWHTDGFVPAYGVNELPDDRKRLRFILDQYLDNQLGYCVHGKMYATSLLSHSGVLFQEEISIGEDLAFNIKLLLTASKIVNCPKQLYTYFNRKGSLSEEIKDGRITLAEYDRFLSDVYQMCRRLADDSADIFWKKHFFVIYARTMDIQFRGKKAWRLKPEMQKIKHSKLWKNMSLQVLKHPLLMWKYMGSPKLFVKVFLLRLF